MSIEKDLQDAIEGIGRNFDEFKAHNEARHTEERQHREELERKINLQRIQGSPGNDDLPTHQWIDTKTKSLVPVLSHKQHLSALAGNQLPSDMKTLPSIGRVLRGICMGGRADDAKQLAEERKALSIDVDPSGGYTVGSALSNQWIDLLRSQMVLSQAGAVTIPMTTGQMSLARVTGDPTVSWHGENADISAGEPTFGAVNMTAKTVVCLVKFSVELAQDSGNIEQILQSTLTNATALAIDSAGLNGVSTNAGAAPTGIMNLSGRNTVTSIGAPTSWDFVVDGMYELMADNVSMDSIGAMVSHPALWKKMRKLKTGIASDNTPLTMPAEVASLAKLWTTSAPLTGGTTAKAIIADWRDLIFGVRQDIQVKVINQAFLGTNLQIGMLVYARCDFAAARAASFCTLEGITV